MEVQDIGVSKKEILRQLIRDRISRGEYKIGDAIPGERILSLKYNMARMTVRMAVDSLINEKMLRRSQGKGTYVIGEGLVFGESRNNVQSRTVSVFLPGPGDSVLIRRGVLEAVCDRMSESGLLVNIHYFTSRSFALEIRRMFEFSPAALVIWYQDSAQNRILLGELSRKNIKFVLVDSYPPNSGFSYVVSDNFGGAYEMTRYLYELGHRNITYVTEDARTSSLMERADGVRQAAADLGIGKADTIEISPDEMNDSRLLKVLKQAVKGHGSTALFACNDILAIKIIDLLKEMKIKVPDDISVAGFDDIDISRHISVPLTTMSQNFYGMGKKAAEMIIAGINGDAGGLADMQCKIGTVFRERMSCAAPK